MSPHLGMRLCAPLLPRLLADVFALVNLSARAMLIKKKHAYPHTRNPEPLPFSRARLEEPVPMSPGT